MSEYQQILSRDEKVLWEGKPQFAPYVARSFITVPFGLIFLSFALTWMNTALSFSHFSPTSIPQPFSLFPLFGVPFVLVGVAITLSPLYSILVHRNIHYIITDKRILIQQGLIGRDFEMVDFDQVKSASVKVGIMDKVFGNNSGTILIDTGRIKYVKHGSEPDFHTLHSISDPYKVFEFFKKVSFDVKTDLQYPNALRPQTNPGYHTQYQPEQKKQSEKNH